MNAYEKAQQLGLTGTDQQIVDQLKASGLTPRKINLGELTLLLRERGMLTKLTYEDPTTGMKWNGSVINMIIGLKASGNPALAGVNKWFSHITDPRSESFDTTILSIATEFFALASAVAGVPTFPSSEDFAAVAGLGGGWLYAGLTVEQFESQRVAAEEALAAILAAQELQIIMSGFQQRFDAIKNQFRTSEKSLGAAALRAMADEWEAE